MSERVEAVGMRVLTDNEFGLVSGGMSREAQVAGTVAAFVAMAAIGGVAAGAVCAAEFAGYGVGYAIDHATK